MNKLKKKAIVLEATKDKQVDFHTFYDESQAKKREIRLINEGWSVKYLN
jgi:hypothetical protein